MRVQLDERPRCEAIGTYEGKPIPCDLHAGHRGAHEWAGPYGKREVSWRDRKPAGGPRIDQP